MHGSSLRARTVPPKWIMLHSGTIWKHRWHYWCPNWCASFVCLMSVYSLLLCPLHARAQVGWTTANQCCFTCVASQSRSGINCATWFTNCKRYAHPAEAGLVTSDRHRSAPKTEAQTQRATAKIYWTCWYVALVFAASGWGSERIRCSWNRWAYGDGVEIV